MTEQQFDSIYKSNVTYGDIVKKIYERQKHQFRDDLMFSLCSNVDDNFKHFRMCDNLDPPLKCNVNYIIEDIYKSACKQFNLSESESFFLFNYIKIRYNAYINDKIS